MIKFFTHKTYLDRLGLFVAWILLIFIINPNGDFPLNDDWCYAKSVKTLIDHSYFKLYNWGEMTLVAHIYYGLLFTKLFGFSFTVLRWSTLLLGFLSVLGIYELCLEIKTSRWIALMTAVLCCVNPIFLGLSYTFMTDVPFYCLTIWALYFFIRSFHVDSWTLLIIAIVLCCWSFLIRQIALVLPLAWAFSFVFVRKKKPGDFLKFMLPLLILLCVYFGYTYFMRSSGLLQERYNDRLYLLFETIGQINTGVLINVFGYLAVSLAYLGFLLAPIQIYFMLKNKFGNRTILGVLYVIFVSGVLIYSGKMIPNLHNVWIDFGIGPTTLFDHYDNFTKTPSPRTPVFIWWFVTILGVFSSVAMLIRLKKISNHWFKKQQLHQPVIFSGFCFLIYLAPFLLVGVYDRYLLPLIPFGVVFLFYEFKGVPNLTFRVVSVFFVLILGMFSTFGVHDYLSWNRTRWKIISNLKEKGINPDHIQGGAEYTTWYYFSEDEEKWWEKVKPIYTLVFETKPDDNVIESWNYDRWLPGEGKIFVVHNDDLE